MNYSYTLEVGDTKIPIDVTDMAKKDKEQAKRLFTYYKMFLEANICTKDDPKKKGLLERIVRSLSEDGIEQMLYKLKEEEGKREVLETVSELLEAYEDEDYENYIDETINGNTFTYLKSIDIEMIRDKLASVGNEMQGKKWRVEIDEDGKVVLCE